MFLISPCRVRIRNRAGQVVAKWWRKGLAQSYFRHHHTPIASHYTWCITCKEGLVCNDAISCSLRKAREGRVWRQGHIMTSLGPMSAVGSGFMGSAWRGVPDAFQSSEFHVSVPRIQNNRNSASYSNWQSIWSLSLCRGKKTKTKRQIRGVPHEHRQRVASGRIFHSIVTVWNYYFNN